ncbi:MAG TPA: VWA domain-containing protein, partial [Blastocatellia bacterium]|nr:VWA domain-containing protein [Blastocatellia bacterium]
KHLSASLASLKRRAGKLIWLNPLLASPEYRPLTRGMQAALPHVDLFAPLHNLQSLRALERHLAL